MRIVYGGFEHETNTFAPSPADWQMFEHGGGWPGMVQGETVWPTIRGKNIPAAGFVEQALAHGAELIPTVWAAASPSGPVTRDAYERIVRLILDGIRAALPVDAVYLDLHGAMVAEHVDDGEGELLRRVRALVGADIPLVASLDLHANVTQTMLDQADYLVAFRTYPHVDMAATGARAWDLLMRRIADGRPPAKAARRVPFLIPISWQCTDTAPAGDLYRELQTLEDPHTHLSFTMAFPAADFDGCTPLVWAYAPQQAQAERLADRLYQSVCAAEAHFTDKTYTPDDAVRYAMAQAAAGHRPIVIADAQDNPGAGSNSDTTGMLRALVRNQARNAALGLMVDPAAMARILAAGAGSQLTLELGGRSGRRDDPPFNATFEVERILTGRFRATGPYFGGFEMDLGPSACLRIDGVRVVVSTHKAQMADQSMFRFAGIEPTQQDILVVKSAVHFRADFSAIAAGIIVAAAPGFMPVDLATLPWRHLPDGLRLMPMGPAFRAPD
ncbi:M81 family metallopeptidase [Affinibrenneria salicis]|uniref:Microcystinase C n=1 Tax=Affinibrenneria salicis TaxID=2590031 RepID=A0A5J5FTJ4_9GAMM|nr:M81 family metallopeptidase [Affinibrenneria salicis]KAA8996905.1 M81 family metallopeptidase [Affinibrenneria salicis]